MSKLRRALLAALSILLVAFVGCATKRDVVSAKVKGRGTQRSYAVTVEASDRARNTTVRERSLHVRT